MKYPLLSIASLLLAFPWQASAQIKVGPWQMHEGAEGLIPFETRTDAQKQAALDKATLPAPGDGGWTPAPVNNGVVDFDRPSRIPGGQGFKQLDFLYFQTTVDIPKDTRIETFQVEFDSVDDGARVWIFNSKHPNGFFDKKNDIITSAQQAKADFSGEAVAGEVNRIIVAQYDLCDPGNTIKGINVIVNGKPVTPGPITPLASHGDVHISTPDGLRYDFQGTGEFLSTLSDDGKVVVQARQESWDQKPSVSVNTAVAVFANGTTFEFYLKPEFQWLINNTEQKVPGKDGAAKRGDGEMSGLGDEPGIRYDWKVIRPGTIEYHVFWSDGSFGVRIIIMEGSHIDYGVARLGGTHTYTGMLGNLDKNPKNDMTLRDGTMVNPPANTEDLNAFTDSWRVKPEESLFGDVKRANALAAEQKPHTEVQIDEAKYAEAEKVVLAAGITDPLAVRNAAYDVAMTDSTVFIETAKTVEADRKALPEEERKVVAGDAATQAVLAKAGAAGGQPVMKEKVVGSGATWEGDWSWANDDGYGKNHSKLIIKGESEFVYIYGPQTHNLKGKVGHSGGDPNAPLCVNLELPNGDHLRFEWKSENEVEGQFWHKGKKQTPGRPRYNEPETTAKMTRVGSR